MSDLLAFISLLRGPQTVRIHVLRTASTVHTCPRANRDKVFPDSAPKSRAARDVPDLLYWVNGQQTGSAKGHNAICRNGAERDQTVCEILGVS